jgi:hypothetical protein
VANQVSQDTEWVDLREDQIMASYRTIGADGKDCFKPSQNSARVDYMLAVRISLTADQAAHAFEDDEVFRVELQKALGCPVELIGMGVIQ